MRVETINLTASQGAQVMEVIGGARGLSAAMEYAGEGHSLEDGQKLHEVIMASIQDSIREFDEVRGNRSDSLPLTLQEGCSLMVKTFRTCIAKLEKYT